MYYFSGVLRYRLNLQNFLRAGILGASARVFLPGIACSTSSKRVLTMSTRFDDVELMPEITRDQGAVNFRQQVYSKFTLITRCAHQIAPKRAVQAGVSPLAMTRDTRVDLRQCAVGPPVERGV